MFKWRMKASNAIFLEDKNGQEGRPFKARFLQAGLVKYDFGVCLLKKETIDKFINTFVECPVIIDHKDDINSSDIVGIIKNIWFSAEDGWFWCDGVISDKKAINLIEDGYNVSCQYRITEYSENVEGKLHNANPYDKEILDGVFEHLAIVENPRYEDAFIAVNAYIAANNAFHEEDHPRDEEGKFSDGDNYFKNWEDAPEIELKGSDLDQYEDIKDLRKAAQDYYKTNLQGKDIEHPKLGKIRISGKGLKEYMHTTGDKDKLKTIPQIPDIIQRGKVGKYEPTHKERRDDITGFYPIYANLKTPTGTKKAETLIGKDKQGNLFYTMFLDYNRKDAQKQRDITSAQDRLSLSNSITHFNLFFNPNVTIDKAVNKFKPVFDYIRKTEGEPMDNETKGLFAALAEALKARNEAEDEKEKKDPKASNEDVDKRKLIDEIGGILKGKVDEELWRTIIGKAEKIAYDKSEAGTADNAKAKNEEPEPKKDDEPKKDKEAENRCKNEDDRDYKSLYEELKAKVDEEAANKKAKNALDETVNKLYSALVPEQKDLYISPEKGLELGKQIYG